MEIIHTVRINVKRKNFAPKIDCVQNGNSYKIDAIIEGLTLTSGMTAMIFVKKPSGKVVYQVATITPETNSISVKLKNQSVIESGISVAQFQIMEGAETVTTFDIDLVVERSVAEESAEESKNILEGLDELIAGAIANIGIDATLTQSGRAADAKAAGDALALVRNKMEEADERIEKLEGDLEDLPATDERKGPDTNSIIRSVNHRGFSEIAPENTLPAYVLSKKNGFDFVETDVSFTSDNIPVLLHDDTVDRTSNGSGSINSMTYDEVRLLDFGSWKAIKYSGVKIPTFEEFMALCKRIGLKPYIEIKNTATYTQAQIDQLVTIVQKHGMIDNVSWISFTMTYLQYVVNTIPTARIGFLKSSSLTSTEISTLKTMRSGGADVFLDLKYTTATESLVNACINHGFPLEVWTVDDETILLSLSDYITGITTNSLNAGKILLESAIESAGDYSAVSDPIVEYNLKDGSQEGILVNVGTLGAAYNATVDATRGGYNYSKKGLSLANGARVNVPIDVREIGDFTIRYNLSEVELNEGIRYLRVFRTDSDIPSVFHDQTAGGWRSKINYSSKSANRSFGICDFDSGIGTDIFVAYNTSKGECVVYDADGNILGKSDSDVYLGLKEGTKDNGFIFGLGDTSGESNYYAKNITFEKFMIYPEVLTSEAIKNLKR